MVGREEETRTTTGAARPAPRLVTGGAILHAGFASFMVILAYLGQHLLGLWTEVNSHFLFLYPAVFASAWLGLYPGLVATAVAAVAGWYFSMPTSLALAIEAPADAVELAVFTLMGAAFSVVSHRRLKARAAVEHARQAEAAAEARLRTLVQSAPIALWAVDRAGTYTTVETSGLPLHGEVLRQVGDSAVDPTHADSGDCSRIERALQGESFVEETEVDGVWHATQYRPTVDAAGALTGMLAVVTDITPLKKLEASQRQVIQQLRREKDLREAFVSTLTHDLRTPLRAARISAELLARNGAHASSAASLPGRIVDHVERMDQMIEGLLNAHRIDAGEKLPVNVRPCELQSLLHSVLQGLSTIHGDRYTLLSSEIVHGYWDPDLLRRIVENLAQNAVKYGSEHHPVTVAIVDSGDHVRISVHNEGEPIPREEQAVLFAPFRRGNSAAARKSNGWGIGLTFVRGAVEAHGGTVEVHSEPGHGTTFCISLPRDARPTAVQTEGSLAVDFLETTRE